MDQKPVPCEDSPPPSNPPGSNLTRAGWQGGVHAADLNGIGDPVLRNCGPGASAPLQADHGEYTCDTSGYVHFDLTGGKLVSKKGDPAWCDRPFDVLTSANSSYNYVWNGDCTSTSPR